MVGSSDGQKLAGIFVGRKLLIPIIEIVFLQSFYLFHCGIQNNAVENKLLLHCIAKTCPKSKEYVIYINFV